MPLLAHAPPPVCLHALPALLAAPAVPVGVDAGCGILVIGGRHGMRLVAKPRRSWPPGAQAPPGEEVTFRGDRVVLVRDGRVSWRSTRSFHPGRHGAIFTTISAAAARGSSVAYVVSRWSGRPGVETPSLFVATIPGRERLTARWEWPLGWTRRGLVTERWKDGVLTIALHDANGALVHAPQAWRSTSWGWDWSRRAVVLRSGRRVLASDGATARLVASAVAPGAAVTPLGGGLVELNTTGGVVVLDEASNRIAMRASLPHGSTLTSLAASSTLLAFTVSPPGAGTTRLVFAVRRGGRRRLLGRYRDPLSCAASDISVEAGFVLVTDPNVARVYDAARPRRVVDLEPVVRWLRRRHRSGTVAWYLMR